MRAHIDDPLFVFAIAFVLQSVAVYAGDLLRKRTTQLRQDERHDFDTVRATTMTLLALIIGFSFSMAVSRYDQRRTLEEAEANAIGTEYLRADLLPADVASQARELLRKYLDLRIDFYEAIEETSGQKIDRDTAVRKANSGLLWYRQRPNSRRRSWHWRSPA
jgi:hypothetical protein